MRIIGRRVTALEARFRVGPETTHDKELRGRLERALKRMADLRASGELPLAPPVHDTGFDRSTASMVEILDHGREQARLRPKRLASV